MRIDTTAPTTTSDAAASYSGNAVITLSASDAGSGVASTEYRLDAGAWTEGTSASTSVGGPHTIQWRSTDALGNTEQTRSATFDVVKRIEQTDTRVYYRGSWWTVTNSSLSGGSHARIASAGAAHLVFDGTGIDLIALKSTNYGIAKVTVDGGTPVFADLYAPSAQFKAPVFSVRGLEDTAHTLKIEWTGTKNAASSSSDISLDAVDVVGTLAADTTAPTTTSTATGAWRTTPETVTLTASDAHSAVTLTRYRVDGGSWVTYGSPFVISSEGTHTVEYYSTDLAGNTESVKTALVRIDKTAPTVTDDATGAWSASAVTVKLTATDTGSGVAQILYSTDGSTPTIPYTGPVTVTDENYTTLKYLATDSVGNATTVKSATVRIDRTPPASGTDADPKWRSHPVNVTFWAGDTFSGVAETFYVLNGADPVAYTEPVLVSKEGTSTIEYWSVDAVGNAETHKFATVRIDTTAPSASDDAPSGWVNGPVSLSISANDALSGIEKVRYSVDGSAPSLTYTGALTISDEGTTTVRYQAFDVAGNAGVEESVIVRVDDTAPVSSDDAPAEWVTDPVTVALEASDAFSGVAQTYYSLDGADPLTYTDPVLVSAEGASTLEYWSVDEVGNVEERNVRHGAHRHHRPDDHERRRGLLLGQRRDHAVGI